MSRHWRSQLPFLGQDLGEVQLSTHVHSDELQYSVLCQNTNDDLSVRLRVLVDQWLSPRVCANEKAAGIV